MKHTQKKYKILRKPYGKSAECPYGEKHTVGSSGCLMCGYCKGVVNYTTVYCGYEKVREQ